MDYSESDELSMIRETARSLVDDYDRDYVEEHIREQSFPHEFWEGSHQAVQHPLAESYSKLTSAREMTYKASWKWDNDMECGLEANTAKLLASEAAEEAASNSIQAHGGNAFNRDYDVLTLWVNSRILQVAPIPNEMIKNFIGEHELNMPASY